MIISSMSFYTLKVIKEVCCILSHNQIMPPPPLELIFNFALQIGVKDWAVPVILDLKGAKS